MRGVYKEEETYIRGFFLFIFGILLRRENSYELHGNNKVLV